MQTDKQSTIYSVAVITSTIGRAHLERAILSVKAQTYPCKHYVFIDGEQFAADAKAILDKYPDVIATYLPMNTGANRWTNSSINAIAPFLVKEDAICYLDDDNWYEPTHVEMGVKTLNESGADYVYSFRNFYSPNGQFISKDTLESIGFYENRLDNPYNFTITVNDSTIKMNTISHKKHHIDTNCYMMRRELAILTSQFWYSGLQNDTNVFNALIKLGANHCSTREFTVNYLYDLDKYDMGFITTLENYFPHLSRERIRQINYQLTAQKQQQHLERHGGVYPWDKD
ncbi:MULTISPECIES: glycosyltransferase family A protein [Glaesserella]|uniref:Glycosyltransferase n=1 Tax=Glaesserella australis TaxID=2094024 RepID=A0A328BYZ4_9PAST|nr:MULTISPECIES: glycosyltransferase family A protein [Glaesserella]AUI65978.1 glycosyltransferase [Glaesserella sp. 15-184]RAL18302.1 glycosyltransferase [Glaesserella australis]